MHTFTTSDSDLTAQVNSIMGFHISAGASAATVLLRNGGASGAIFVEAKVPAGESVHFAAARPILFPKGLYIDTDANVSRGAVQPG